MRHSIQPTSHEPLVTSHSRVSAFTLLEMSIVLVIIAVVIGGGMTIFSASLQKRQLQETQMKLKAIQKALLDFRIANNRIPCPADVTLVLTDTNFGVEGATPGTCTGGTPAANYKYTFTASGTTVNNSVTVTVTTTNIVVGMAVTGTGIPPGDSVAATPTSNPASSAGTINLTIPATTSATNTLTFGSNAEGLVPTNTLHLPDDYALDGWGRRIMYAVDVRFTASGALVPYPSILSMYGYTHSSITVDTITSTTGLSVKMFVYGSGIPVADTVASITSATAITLTTAAAATINASPGDWLTFSTVPIPATVILGTDATSRMTVNDASGNAKTTKAAYVLVSFGPNGHGAFPRNGAAIGSRISAGSTNASEQNNCDCNSSAVSNAIIPAGVFVQKQPTLDTASVLDSFDDVVAFGTRSDLRAPTE